jgi:putative ABC transport system ATP-binding protein
MIRLAEAEKHYYRGTPDERAALDRVSAEIAPGSFTLVIGSNGAGKSTLLAAISGAVALDAGRIEIDGEDVTRSPEHRRAKRVARVLQDPMLGTLPSLTVAENLALAEMRAAGPAFSRALTRARRARYAAALELFGLGLEARLEARAGVLSGGQRQVLALAMAAISEPQVLLLDEHCAALDPRTAELVMAATLRAVAAGRLTTLMVTHNMQHAIRYGDRVLMMHAGRIVLDAAGPEKVALSVESLVERFHLADDKMLLA